MPLEAVVEEAVAAGEITPEDGAVLEEAIEAAAVEAVEDESLPPPSSSRHRARCRGSRGRRGGRASLARDHRARDGHAAGCGRKAPQAELLRFGAVDGRLTSGAHTSRPGRLHLPAARVLRARGGVAQAFNRVLRRTVIVEPELERHYTDS